MPDGTGIEPQSRLDSGEYYERVKRRWMPMVWIALILAFCATPMYCITEKASKAELEKTVIDVKKTIVDRAPSRVEFAVLQTQVRQIDERTKETNAKLERLIEELRKSRKNE